MQRRIYAPTSITTTKRNSAKPDIKYETSIPTAINNIAYPIRAFIHIPTIKLNIVYALSHIIRIKYFLP